MAAKVPKSDQDHVFSDIRAWYVQYKYKFFGVVVPTSSDNKQQQQQPQQQEEEEEEPEK